MISLVKNIVATLAYYDVMNYPLTAFEVWKHFLSLEADISTQEVTIGSVRETLQMLVKEDRIGSDRGFYFLQGRDCLVDVRLSHGKVSVERLKRVRSLVFWMRFFPFVRMIGVTGSLAMEQSDASSDWDLLIVLKKGRIFTGRVIVTVMLHIFGKRRHRKKTKNRACLNYWITDDSLEIGLKDVYSAHEYRFLLPFFGWETYRKFEIANRWIVRYEPQFSLSESPPNFLVRDVPMISRVRRFLENLLDFDRLEQCLERVQKKKISKNPLSALPGGYIEASENALVFLPRPRGPKVFELFRSRLSRIRVL